MNLGDPKFIKLFEGLNKKYNVSIFLESFNFYFGMKKIFTFSSYGNINVLSS